MLRQVNTSHDTTSHHITQHYTKLHRTALHCTTQLRGNWVSKANEEERSLLATPHCIDWWSTLTPTKYLIFRSWIYIYLDNPLRKIILNIGHLKTYLCSDDVYRSSNPQGLVISRSIRPVTRNLESRLDHINRMARNVQIEEMYQFDCPSKWWSDCLNFSQDFEKSRISYSYPLHHTTQCLRNLRQTDKGSD